MTFVCRGQVIGEGRCEVGSFDYAERFASESFCCAQDDSCFFVEGLCGTFAPLFSTLRVATQTRLSLFFVEYILAIQGKNFRNHWQDCTSAEASLLLDSRGRLSLREWG
jgi:hypothetical protein